MANQLHGGKNIIQKFTDHLVIIYINVNSIV